MKKKKMPGLDKANIENILMLTPMQGGMLLHYLQEPAGEQYTEQLSLQISGAIDALLFEKAWNAVVAANEMLRTQFRWEKLTQPTQVILKKHRCTITFHDLSGESPGVRQAALEEAKKRGRRFDLQHVPFGIILCKLAEESYELTVSHHHILYDGWSNGIILKEFFNLYNNQLQNHVIPAKTCFKSYVKWLLEQDKSAQEAFWKSHLKETDQLSLLPVDSESTLVTESEEVMNTCHLFHGKFQHVQHISKFIKQHHLSYASLLYTAWGLLLRKYTGKENPLFGTTVSGRSAKLKDIERMVGLFIQTPPLALSMPEPDKESLLSLLVRVKELLMKREPFESTPLVDIKRYSRVDCAGELFNTIVVVENYPLDLQLTPKGSPLTIQSYSETGLPHYDLCLSVDTALTTPEASISYRADRFSRRRIETLWSHFCNILRELVGSPYKTIDQIRMLSSKEVRFLMEELNDTAVDYDHENNIPEMFQKQVVQTPDRVAVVYEEQRLSYEQLNISSNRLAHLLMSRGVSTGMIVAILLEPSIDRVIAMLAILKAGAAYLPIDPELPDSRIVFMLADCMPVLVLSHQDMQLKHNVSPHEMLNLDKCAGILNNCASTNPQSRTESHHPAYIMFTSGSTGKPKGVLVEHRQVMNNLRWFGRTFGISSGVNLLQLSDYTFDPSVEDIFGSLTHGAQLHLSDKDLIMDRDSFRDYIRYRQIHIIDYVPAMLDELLGIGERLSSLTVVIVGGMRLEPAVKERLLSIGYPLYNNYGPTETTVDAINTKCGPGPVVLGKPIDNAQCFILDCDRSPAPVGVAGELAIAGAGLAAGYLNNPELTAEKFISLDFNQPSPTRVYLSGDTARWLPDGTIQFLGRRDRQLKIRGNRVEPGEIELGLFSHPAVSQAHVLADGEPEIRLTAFVQLNDGGVNPGTSAIELSDYLSGILPGYMVPSFFVLVDQIPRTPGGKIDVWALSKLKTEFTVHQKELIPPHTKTQHQLSLIWAQSLEIEPSEVGIRDDFFSIGGHSLKAFHVISRIHKQMDIKVPIRVFFKRPTIEALSIYIENAQKQSYQPLPKAPVMKRYPLSTAQKQLYLGQLLELESTGYNMHDVVALHGSLSIPRLEEAFNQLIQRHEILRTAFIMMEDEPAQVIQSRVDFKIEHLGIPPVAHDPLSHLDTFIRPFDLTQVPLLRVGIMKLAEDRHLMILDLHHMVSDGVSMRLFLRDFKALYRVAVPTGKNGTKTLPPLTIQYKDFAHWQNSRYQDSGTGTELLNQECYWMQEFAGGETPLNLPLDFPRPQIARSDGATLHFQVDNEYGSAVKQLARREELTVFMVWLTIYYILLSLICRQEKIRVATPMAGRSHADLEPLIGLFVNMLTLSVRVSGHMTFKQLLRRVKRNTESAYQNQDYPYQMLVDKVVTHRDAGRNPLFDTIFVWEDLDIDEVDFSLNHHHESETLTIVPYRYEKTKTPYDFSLVGSENQSGDGVGFAFYYKTSLFKRETVERIVNNFEQILIQVVKNPDIMIDSIELTNNLLVASSNGILEDEGDFSF